MQTGRRAKTERKYDRTPRGVSAAQEAPRTAPTGSATAANPPRKLYNQPAMPYKRGGNTVRSKRRDLVEVTMRSTSVPPQSGSCPHVLSIALFPHALITARPLTSGPSVQAHHYRPYDACYPLKCSRAVVPPGGTSDGTHSRRAGRYQHRHPMGPRKAQEQTEQQKHT